MLRVQLLSGRNYFYSCLTISRVILKTHSNIGELAPRSGGLFMGPPNKTESALVWYGCRSENGLYIKKETRRCSIFYANFIFRFFCVFNMKGSHRSWKKIFCEIISIGRPPPPSVGTKDQIFRQIQFEGSPNS